MNNQVIKLRANTSHFGHHDHPAPPVSRPATHSGEDIPEAVPGPLAGKSSQRASKAAPESSKNVPFRFKHPSAKKVLLAGEFTDWEKKPIALTKNKAGEWQATVALFPGHYRYRFLVDDSWHDDPNASERVPNPFGTCDCVAKVS